MSRGGGGPTYNKISFAHTFYMVIHHIDRILSVAKVDSPAASVHATPGTPEPDSEIVKQHDGKDDITGEPCGDFKD